MRRASMAIVAAAVGTAALVGLKAQHGGGPAGLVATGPLDPGAEVPGGPPAGSGSPTPRPTAAVWPSVGASAPARPSPSNPAARPITAGPAPTARTLTGTREQAGRYGYVRVKITMTGRQLTAVTMLEETSEPNDAARRAPSILIQEALAAQSADIGNVSQATYTSDAFKASLRAALAKA
jgi:uncharacterized protein with FMN-binding domain